MSNVATKGTKAPKRKAAPKAAATKAKAPRKAPKAVMPAKKRRTVTPLDIETAEKMAEALEMRKEGCTFGVIAERMGYFDASGASKIVKRAMALTIQEPADEVRRLELERLDMMLKAINSRVKAGEPRAIEVALQIGDRRAKLLGLDAPTKMETDSRSLQVQVSHGMDLSQLTVPEIKTLQELRQKALVAGDDDEQVAGTTQ